jgi:hypothetical protein
MVQKNAISGICIPQAIYGPNLADRDCQLGVFVGRILHGENPGDLPVQQVSNFEPHHQPENCQGVWSDHSQFTAVAGRRGGRMMTFFTAAQNVRFWHKADMAITFSDVRY